MAKHLKEFQPPIQNQDDFGPLGKVQIVSGRWLVKAIVAVLAFAVIAIYLTVCALFYHGQSQVIFFPPDGKSPSIASLSVHSGLPITNVSFDTTEEGTQRLNGWWIPSSLAPDANAARTKQAAASDKIASMVLLYCPNGRTDLPKNIGALQTFHALGISVFAFDYRGFGASRKTSPSQKKSYEDGIAALHYLTGIRHLNPAHIVVYGAGLGAAVAATVAQQSPGIAGLILENPQPSLTRQVKREQRLHLLPMWLLFRQNFDISRTVSSLTMPKLVLVSPILPEYVPGAEKIYAETPTPKQKVLLHPGPGVPTYKLPQWSGAVRSFLDALATPSTQ